LGFCRSSIITEGDDLGGISARIARIFGPENPSKRTSRQIVSTMFIHLSQSRGDAWSAQQSFVDLFVLQEPPDTFACQMHSRKIELILHRFERSFSLRHEPPDGGSEPLAPRFYLQCTRKHLP
jgi:hypothetical protein